MCEDLRTALTEGFSKLLNGRIIAHDGTFMGNVIAAHVLGNIDLLCLHCRLSLRKHLSYTSIILLKCPFDLNLY
jgi:hypothetical protein